MKNPIFLQTGFSFGGPLEHTLLADIRAHHFYSRIVPFPKNSDSYWMLEALREATKGIGISNPNPSVGCILVNSTGEELARGATQRFRSFHAEQIAFNQIQDSSLLAGGTAFITLEPCSHTGSQPPCVNLLIASKIKRVVIARSDPNPLVQGEGIRKLIEGGKTVSLGTLAAESTAWNFTFITQQIMKRPCIILKWAQTLDGQLADDTDNSKWISGPAARSYTHWLRQRYDTVLVGARTFLRDLPSLSVRDCAFPHQAQPIPILFDPYGICLRLTPENETLLNERTWISKKPFIFVTQNFHKQNFENSWLGKKSNGFLLTVSPGSVIADFVHALSVKEVTQFAGRPLQSVLVEGGPRTHRAFLNEGFADLLHVFVAPTLSGGYKNRIFLEKSLQTAQSFELVSKSQLGNDTLLEMIPSKMRAIFDETYLNST